MLQKNANYSILYQEIEPEACLEEMQRFFVAMN